MNAPEIRVDCSRAATRCHPRTVLLALVAIFAATPCNAYDVLLRWTVPPEPGIAGYRVYRGQASGTYASPVDVGGADSSTLSGVVYYLSQNLPLGTANYVAVTAYNSGGAESDYSNEKLFNLLVATPPSVNAGLDQTATVGALVSLGSSPNAGINYFWDETTGPAATLTSATTSRTQFTPQMPGAYTFALTAYDAQGIAARDSVMVIVTAAATMTPAITVTPQPTPVPTSSRTATRTAVPSSTPTRTATSMRTSTPTRGATEVRITTATPTVQGSNDTCTNAVFISAAAYSSTITTNSATSAAADPPVGCGNGSRAKSVWYRFTSPSDGTLTANTFGSNYDTILAAYTGSCGAFTAVPAACNDDSSGVQSRVSFTTTAGTTYYFLVSAYSANGGSLVFQLTFQSTQRTATPSPTRTRTPSPTTTFVSKPG
jgi:hypothetical protein